jgi:PD-(D/E)XK nuclease superfamily
MARTSLIEAPRRLQVAPDWQPPAPQRGGVLWLPQGSPKGKDVLVVSQSWLKDLMFCPRRAQETLRASIGGTLQEHTTPEASAGSLLHAIIEQHLTTGLPKKHDWLYELEFAKTKISEDHGWYREAQAYGPGFLVGLAWDGWKALEKDGALLQVDTSRLTLEQGLCRKFPDSPAGDMPCEVWMHGTPDCIDGSWNFWDWKFSSAQWYEATKQKYDIQSTSYAWLSGLLDWDTSNVAAWNFLVVSSKDFKVKRLQLTRGAEHYRRLWSLVHSAAVDVVRWWETQDRDSHNWLASGDDWLCSPKWCPYWDRCLGSLGMTSVWPTK